MEDAPWQARRSARAAARGSAGTARGWCVSSPRCWRGDAAELVTSQTTSCCQSRAFPGSAPQLPRAAETQLREQQATCDLWVPSGQGCCCSDPRESLPRCRQPCQNSRRGLESPRDFPGTPPRQGGPLGRAQPHTWPRAAAPWGRAEENKHRVPK